MGLLAHKLRVRPEAEGETDEAGKPPQPNSPGDEKERVRWGELLRLSTQDILAGTRVVTVADREADIYVTAQQLGKEVLVRAIHNRQLARGKQHLWDVVEQAAVVGSMVIEVPRADAG